MRAAAYVAGRARQVRNAIAGRRLQRRLAGPRLLRAFADAYPRATFVEIGANDGERWDHLQPLIRRGGWRGVMVEPVPYLFARLQVNYADVGSVTPVNVAIADRDGQLAFHHLAEAPEAERAQLPDYYEGLGSFSLDNVLAHTDKIPDLQERLVSTEVPTLTFASLCAREGLDEVDLVVIDTEGYDAEIVRHLDIARWRPRVLVYEHFHLSDADREELRELLAPLGYALLEEGFDSFWVDLTEDDELSRAFRQLRPAVGPVTAATEHAS